MKQSKRHLPGLNCTGHTNKCCVPYLPNNLVLASNDVLSSQVDVECDRSPAGKSGVSHLLIYADHQRGYHNNMSCKLFRIPLGNVLHSLPGSAGGFHESF